MALDFSVLERAPTIAQGFLAGQQAAQQQAEQNRLRDLQMLQMEAQRENILAQRSQREQELRERQAAEAARNALATVLAKGGDEADLIRLGPAGIEAAAKLTALNKARGEVFTQRMTAARQFLDTIDPADPSAPQRFLQWHEANHRDPIIGPMLAARGITADQARSRIEQAVQQGPQALANLIAQSKLGTEKFMEMNAPKFFTQSLGGTERIVSTPGLGGAAQVVPGSVAVKTMTPGEAKPTVSNIDVGGAILTQEYNPVTGTTRVIGRQTKTLTPEQMRTIGQEANVVAHTTTDETGKVTLYNKFGRVVTPTGPTGAPTELRGKPSATFEKTTQQRKQLSQDLNTAIFELKEAVKPGGLIEQSTGSGAGRLADIAARSIGVATEGDIAISKLKPIADIVLKMVPRFEGPQSDKDTQSYKEAAGQLADPGMPRKIRMEAAKTIIRLMENRKGQFVSTDMAAQGTTAGGGVDTSNPLLK